MLVNCHIAHEKEICCLRDGVIICFWPYASNISGRRSSLIRNSTFLAPFGPKKKGVNSDLLLKWETFTLHR